MSDADNAVQAAIYARLAAALSVTVTDAVDQDTPPDYVLVGDDTGVPSNSKTENGVEHNVQIDVYSSSLSRKTVKVLMKQVYDELHNQPITVTGFSATPPLFQFSDSAREEDGTHGVIRFALQTTPE